MTNEEKIAMLEQFQDLLRQWSNSHHDDLRSKINRQKVIVQRIVDETGCLKFMSISPAPAVGGPILHNVDPFAMMFEFPHGMNLIPSVIDQIDEAIGVLSAEPEKETNERTEVHQANQNIRQGYAFIAMPMNPQDHSLDDVLEAIKETAREFKIKAERIDESQSNERITDRILESIQSAQFVIVDLTGFKPNVLFEAGYAHGLGKIPIYIAREGTQLEFDLKDYPVIFYQNMKTLKSNLKRRLAVLIGEEI